MREEGETSPDEADNVDAEDEDYDEVEIEELRTGLERNVGIELKPAAESANVRKNMSAGVSMGVHDEGDQGHYERGALGIADVEHQCPGGVG